MQKAFAPARYKRADDRGLFVEVIAEGSWEAVIHGKMHTGAVLGNHYHLVTRIYLYLTSGEAQVHVVRIKDGGKHSFTLTGGHGSYLEEGEAHAIKFTRPSEFILVKSRRHDPLDPDTFPYEVDTD